MLVKMYRNSRKGLDPCGECFLPPGTTCDVCGAKNPEDYDHVEVSFVKKATLALAVAAIVLTIAAVGSWLVS